jgi:2-oxoglutarate ferredoxin oxidoreductase subunit delta
MAKGYVRIDDERCKGCELCISACPQEVLRMDRRRLNSKGYHPSMLDDPAGKCTGCALCAVICPDLAITVFRYAPPPRVTGGSPA